MNQELYRKKLQQAIEALKKLELYQLDSDTKKLKEGFEILYQHGIFELYKVDKSEHNDYKFILFSELSKHSGSLAFLAIQILASHAIMASRKFPRREVYFGKRCGIAINHLRAPITIVSANKCEGGYRLQGRLTWASGYGIFDTLLIGFHHEGEEYEAMAPFKSSECFKIGEVAHSFVGNSMATVNIELQDFFIPEEDIVSSNPMGSYTHAKSVSKTIHFALYGIGIGAVEALSTSDLKKEASEALESIKKEFFETNNGEEMDHLRIKLFLLVQKIITTGMILYGGKSLLIEETMQRYYRELIMFNANGLNHKIKMLFKEEFLTELSS